MPPEDSPPIDYHRNALRILFILAKGCKAIGEPPVEGYDYVFVGESKVQALDFWVRYPDYLADELLSLFEKTQNPDFLAEAQRIFDHDEPDIRRVPMLRKYFGAYEPLDTVLGILKSRELVLPRSRPTAIEKDEHEFLVSSKARDLVARIAKELQALRWYDERVDLVLRVAGDRGGFALKKRQHEQKEYHDTRTGDLIPTTAERVRRRLKELSEGANV